MKRLAKLGLAAFVAVFLVLCLVPSAGMLVSPTREAVGNEMLALMPTLRDTGGTGTRTICPSCPTIWRITSPSAIS